MDRYSRAFPGRESSPESSSPSGSSIFLKSSRQERLRRDSVEVYDHPVSFDPRSRSKSPDILRFFDHSKTVSRAHDRSPSPARVRSASLTFKEHSLHRSPSYGLPSPRPAPKRWKESERMPQTRTKMGWLEHALVDLPFDREWEAFDCMVACDLAVPGDVPNTVVSSPNMKIIPIPVVGDVQVRWSANGWFGRHDPVCWPQRFNDWDPYRWMMAVRIPPQRPDDHLAPLWRPLRADPQSPDIERASPTSQLYIVSKKYKQDLTPLVTVLLEHVAVLVKAVGRERCALLETMASELRNSVALLSYPSSKSELVRAVANVQRHWLFADAWVEWHTVLFPFLDTTCYNPDIARVRPSGVRTDIIGGFTSDPMFASKVFDKRIPVWLLRSPSQVTSEMVVKELVDPLQLVQPVNLPRGLFPQEPIYVGPTGKKQIDAIVRASMSRLDNTAGRAIVGSQSTRRLSEPGSAARHATPTAGRLNLAASNRGAESSKSQTKHQMSAERRKPAPTRHPNDHDVHFDPPPVSMLAPALPAWANALKAVDRTRPAPRNELIWKFFVPDPSTLVRFANPLRVDVHLQHWLELRKPWYARLRELEASESAPCLRSKQWTDLLDIGVVPDVAPRDTHTGTRRLVTIGHFMNALGEYPPCLTADVSWYGRELTAFGEEDAMQITWEIAMVGFRMELRALDRCLVRDDADVDSLILTIFGGQSLIREALPTEHEGLDARVPAVRLRSLEALRKLLVRWPGVPDSIASANPIPETFPDEAALVTFEHTICLFYVQTFWEVAGRAATIPREYVFA